MGNGETLDAQAAVIVQRVAVAERKVLSQRRANRGFEVVLRDFVQNHQQNAVVKRRKMRLPMQSHVVDPAVRVDLARHVVPLRKTAANGGEKRFLEYGFAKEAHRKSAAAEIDFFARGEAISHFLDTQVPTLR